jgi:hypothetical protein
VDYSEWVAALQGGLTDLAQRLTEYLPSILAALALLLGGWLLARLMRSLIPGSRAIPGRRPWR